MKIVTYLGFTLLSICIQFSVIDFIQGRLKLQEKQIGLNGTSPKRQLRDILKDINPKSHALYYRTQQSKGIRSHSPAKLLSNTTITELLATTDIPTTVFDILYDDNSTSTEESFTTESFYASSDIENVTEITFFEKNETTTESHHVPKQPVTEDCSCNLLFNVCDINCCCDNKCLDFQIKLFPNCAKNTTLAKDQNDDGCVSQLPYFGYGNGLFCIVKVNLPERRDMVQQKTDQVPTEHFLKWKSNGNAQIIYEFSNKIYQYGDPIWLLKNVTIYHIDLPSPTVNNYCMGRKAIQFLKDEKYSCNVKIRDLEMFQIMKSLKEVTVISATPISMNSSVLNCTNLHCVNWTILICNNIVCTNYSKSIHEPTCTESGCTNIALKIDYIFYYHDSKIINVTIKFHIRNVTLDLPFMPQEIQVKFVLGNESIDKILKLSGNPGYLDGLPIIVSYAEENYTDEFYNNTKQMKRYLLLPENHNGYCISLNSSENFILFGRNRRFNCRYEHKIINPVDVTNECKNIQNNINKLLGLNNKVLVSPLGNPHHVKDKDWLSIEKPSSPMEPIYGEVHETFSKFLCFNLITRYSLSFAHLNGNNRIVSCKYDITAKNISFDTEDISTVVTIDITFIDVTKPSVIEYATGPPTLNIHLPDDFFYPFRSNESRNYKCNIFIMMINFIAITLCK